MSTPKALLSALAVTVISGILLTIMKGVPTTEQAVSGCTIMFVLAFVVTKFSGRESQ
jgi:hypothetical protein